MELGYTHAQYGKFARLFTSQNTYTETYQHDMPQLIILIGASWATVRYGVHFVRKAKTFGIL